MRRRALLMAWGIGLGTVLGLAGSLGAIGAMGGEKSAEAPLNPAAVPGLVAFWDFQEEAGKDRVAKGKSSYRLQEMNGPIDVLEEGVFGPRAAHLSEKQWFRIPRAEIGELDIHGKDAKVTVIAWIRSNKRKNWQAIGGVWDESRKKRQYYMFFSGAKKTDSRTMTRTPTSDRINGHISAVGGPTPGHDFCVTYATGGTPIETGEWKTVAMTYDGEWIRVYVDGKLDTLEHHNPFPYKDGIFDGGVEGADFTIGSNSVGGKPSNFFVGDIAGLAVYDRALDEQQIAELSEWTKRGLYVGTATPSETQ